MCFLRHNNLVFQKWILIISLIVLNFIKSKLLVYAFKKSANEMLYGLLKFSVETILANKSANNQFRPLIKFCKKRTTLKMDQCVKCFSTNSVFTKIILIFLHLRICCCFSLLFKFFHFHKNQHNAEYIVSKIQNINKDAKLQHSNAQFKKRVKIKKKLKKYTNHKTLVYKYQHARRQKLKLAVVFFQENSILYILHNSLLQHHRAKSRFVMQKIYKFAKDSGLGVAGRLLQINIGCLCTNEI